MAMMKRVYVCIAVTSVLHYSFMCKELFGILRPTEKCSLSSIPECKCTTPISMKQSNQCSSDSAQDAYVIALIKLRPLQL